MQNPIITIITVSMNDMHNLSKTAKTVFEQTYENIEYIVVDGGSSDETIEFIKNNEKKISRWISEKDNGIYDAMNKGISLASGDFICFMNCGDILVANDVIETIAQKIIFDNIDSNFIVYSDFSRKGLKYHQPDYLDFYLYIRPMCHQSLYIGKDVFKKLGNYDLNYEVLADYEHTLRSYRNNVPFVHCKCVSCDYLSDGFSDSKENQMRLKAETTKIRFLYFTKRQLIIFTIRYRLTFPFLRQILFSDSSPLWIRNCYRKVVHVIMKLYHHKNDKI